MRLQSTVSGWERTSQKQRHTALKSKEKRINKEIRRVEGGHRRRSISSAWWWSSVNTSCQDRKESAEGFVHHWMTSLSTITAFLSHVYNTVLVNCHQKKKYWNFQWRSNFTCSRSSVVNYSAGKQANVGKPGEDTKRFGFANIFTWVFVKNTNHVRKSCKFGMKWWDGAERYPLTLIKKNSNGLLWNIDSETHPISGGGSDWNEYNQTSKNHEASFHKKIHVSEALCCVRPVEPVTV